MDYSIRPFLCALTPCSQTCQIKGNPCHYFKCICKSLVWENQTFGFHHQKRWLRWVWRSLDIPRIERTCSHVLQPTAISPILPQDSTTPSISFLQGGLLQCAGGSLQLFNSLQCHLCGGSSLLPPVQPFCLISNQILFSLHHLQHLSTAFHPKDLTTHRWDIGPELLIILRIPAAWIFCISLPVPLLGLLSCKI